MLYGAFIQKLLGVVEPSAREVGNGLGVSVEAVDDTEASVFWRYLLHQFFDKVDVDPEATRGVAGCKDYGRGCIGQVLRPSPVASSSRIESCRVGLPDDQRRVPARG